MQSQKTGIEQVTVDGETHFMIFAKGKKAITLSPKESDVDVIQQGSLTSLKCGSGVVISSLVKFAQSLFKSHDIDMRFQGCSECTRDNSLKTLIDIEEHYETLAPKERINSLKKSADTTLECQEVLEKVISHLFRDNCPAKISQYG